MWSFPRGSERWSTDHVSRRGLQGFRSSHSKMVTDWCSCVCESSMFHVVHMLLNWSSVLWDPFLHFGYFHFDPSYSWGVRGQNMDSVEGKDHDIIVWGDNGGFDCIVVCWRSFQLQDFCGHRDMCQKHFPHTGFVCDWHVGRRWTFIQCIKIANLCEKNST
jgi:hypothetical protein